jgi:hypothetical protein
MRECSCDNYVTKWRTCCRNWSANKNVSKKHELHFDHFSKKPRLIVASGYTCGAGFIAQFDCFNRQLFISRRTCCYVRLISIHYQSI